MYTKTHAGKERICTATNKETKKQGEADYIFPDLTRKEFNQMVNDSYALMNEYGDEE